ncbi:MAG TPA: TIGR03118 family protein [Gaiellaceae bacterium]|nr:TIGR03118 family protein [Gaiellaceae bacterium]
MIKRVAAVCVLAAAVAAVLSLRDAEAYRIDRLVSDRGLAARVHDRALVNAWGLAASPTGPWWVASEARSSSTVYAASGRKQALTVRVEGGPTGVVYNGGSGFVVRAGRASGPARFIYACEDGTIRGWSPVVPHGWSTEAEVAVDATGTGAVFRGVALAHGHLYATDFHNGRVVVFDRTWHRVVRRGAFTDPRIPAWYSPFGIVAAGSSIFVSYAYPAPVNGNDAPSGGYVDEFSLDGRLVARVGTRGALHEPWGMAVAPPGFGRYGNALLVASFGTGRIAAFARTGRGWRYAGSLPVHVQGVWGIAFGNGGMAGEKDTLFFAAGPHRWRGASELAVHGLLGAIRRTG